MPLRPEKVHVRVTGKLAPGELVHAVAELHGVRAGKEVSGPVPVSRAVTMAGGALAYVATAAAVKTAHKVGHVVAQARLQGTQDGMAAHVPVRPIVMAVTNYRVLFFTLSALRCRLEAAFLPSQLTAMRLERGVQGRSALMFSFVDGSVTGRALAHADAGQRANDLFLRMRRGELAASPVRSKR